MARLKYYDDEDRRHPLLNSTRLNFEQAVKLTDWLCERLGLEKLKVLLLDRKVKQFSRVRKTKSWYSASRGEIVYHPSMLNPLTVVHEVAHYAHHMDHKIRYDKALAWWSANKEYIDTQGRLRRRKFPLSKERSHGPEHLGWVERGVELLKAHPDLNAQLSPAEALAADIEFDLSPTPQSFFAALPDRLTCPCCKATLPKDRFGIRIMKRDSYGNPLKIRPQSYCKACR